MFLISNKEMMVAGAEAGVLGSMPSSNARTSEKFRDDLAWICARTDKPFAIDLTIGLGDPARLESDCAACEDFAGPAMLTSDGTPATWVKRAHEHKMLLFRGVVSLRHGQKAVAAGVDGIIAVTAGVDGRAGRRRAPRRRRRGCGADRRRGAARRLGLRGLVGAGVVRGAHRLLLYGVLVGCRTAAPTTELRAAERSICSDSVRTSRIAWTTRPTVRSPLAWTTTCTGRRSSVAARWASTGPS